MNDAKIKIQITNKEKITPYYARVIKRFKSFSYKYPVKEDMFYSPDFLEFFYPVQKACKFNADPVLELRMLKADALPEIFRQVYPFPVFFVFASTMGTSADELINYYAKQNEIFKSYLIDAWFSESVEVINEIVESFIIQALKPSSYSRRFSPGYGKIDIKQNIQVDKAANFTYIDVNPDSGILLPRKSTICLLGGVHSDRDPNINDKVRRSIYENLNSFFASQT